MSKTVSQRRAELESDRFISVRNLAYATYKKPDPSGQLGPDGQVLLVPLMTYEETLTDRQAVYNAILQYELANNLITPDGPESHVQIGAPVSAQPLPPPPGFAPPAGVPAFAPPAMPAAPFVPSTAPAAPATAQQAAMAPAVPPPAAAPTEGQTRRRRTPSTAVAPPTAAPAPVAQPEPAPQAFVPPAAPAFAPAVPQAPAAFAPPAAPQFSPPAAPAAASSGSVDLTPVTQKVDQLGGVVNSLITGLEEMKKQLAAVQQQNDMLLAALSHLYMVNPQTAPIAQQAGKNISNLPGFKEYLGGYLPR